MKNNIVLHALQLIEAGDYKQLEYFLSNVQNIKRLWRRALRLGAWRRISRIKWGLITIVANTLEKIRSKTLLKSIIEAFEALVPNLLMRMEMKILEASKEMMSLIRNINLDISIPLEEYVFIQSINKITIEYIGFTIG
jgi:hypothetical protein